MERAGSGEVAERHLYLLYEWRGLWQTGEWTPCLEEEAENQLHQSLLSMQVIIPDLLRFQKVGIFCEKF